MRCVTADQESEHRRVTVAFVHFDGTDEMISREGPEVTADRLDVLVTITQRAVERQEVTFLATDADRDGGKIILVAGAPATSGDDEHRMLLAVREIMDAGAPLPIRIGVNRGSVFVGEVGPPYRRTFTVMGDAVNLAARLMAKAETGQILSTPELLARSRTRFETVDLEPFYVKGKSRPVQAQAVGARMGARAVGTTDELPLLGREAEMRQLAELAAAAAAGHGSVVEIVGETGSGKSRLVSALRQIASDRMQLTAVCERYDSSTPYHEVRRLLRSLLDLPSEGGDERVAARFLAELESRAPELLPWAPLIAMAIGVTVPETPESRDLEEEFRRPRLASVVIELLAKLLPDAGLFVIEDAHNMDEASADLFGHLAAAVGATSWLWCTTRSDVSLRLRRPRGDQHPDRARAAERGGGVGAGPRRHRRRPSLRARAVAAGRPVGREPPLPSGVDRGSPERGRRREPPGVHRGGGRRSHRPTPGRRPPPPPSDVGPRAVVPGRSAGRRGRRSPGTR